MEATDAAPPPVHASLCLAQAEAKDADDLLRQLARTAFAAGYVHAGFEEALLAREAVYPTGLPGEPPLAIPHADAQHVRRAGMGVAVLRGPVSFRNMGDPSELLPVRTAFLLLVRDPGAQLPALVALSALVQRPGWQLRLLETRSAPELAAAANALLAEVSGGAGGGTASG